MKSAVWNGFESQIDAENSLITNYSVSVSPRFDVLSHKRLPTARNGHSMTTQLVTPATTQGMVGGGWGSIPVMLGTLRGHWVLHAAKPQGRLPCLQESTESDEGSISVLIFEIV